MNLLIPRWVLYTFFISFILNANENVVQTLYYVNEFDFTTGHPTPKSEINYKPHIRVEYDSLDRIISKANFNRRNIIITKESFSYEYDSDDPIEKRNYEGDDRLVRKTIFGLRGKAPDYISYVYGLDSLKTWKDDVFTVVNYNEFEKPYLFQLFDVNAVGYANALLDYNEQGWLTRQVWKRLPDGKEMRLWNYNFDPETNLTRIMEFDSTKTLVMDILLNPDSLEAVYDPIFPIDSGYVNSTVISFELLDSLHIGYITWRWVGGTPDLDSTHIFKIPDSLYHKRLYDKYDLMLDDYLIDGAKYNIEFTGKSAFDFEIIKEVIPYVTYDITPPTISIGSKPAINKPEFYFTTDEPLSQGYIEWIPFPSTSQQDTLHLVNMNDNELKLGLKQYIVLENQTPLLDSAKYNLHFTAYDRARNQSFFQAEELILYDISPPLVYMYYPLSNTYVNHLEVQVEASELLASGQIILTDLSGVRDTLSPHIYQLPKKELELGLHAALLDEALPIMDTTTYSFKYIGIDPAGNISEPAIREPIYYDISPPIYTQIFPTVGSHVNNPRLSFIVSEDLAAGEFTWTYREGLKDTSAPHVIALITNERKGDTRTNWMLKNQTDLVDGTVYDLIFIGQDLAGNQTGFITTPNITYDITLPVFSILDPIEGAYANYLSISYELSEPLKDGSITWTALNGTKDPQSPRIISMELDEMVEGISSNILLNNMTSLIDSVTYSIEMQGTDLATNVGIPFKVSEVQYDFSPPIILLTYPTENTYQSKTFLNYQLSEDLLYGQVSWIRLYTRGVKPDTVILQGPELIAGINDTITFVGMKKLIDGASYDLVFDGYDLAKNDAISQRINNVTYDFTPPEIELQYPQTLSSVNNINISYTLSEFLLEGTATWKWVDGVLDTKENIQILEPYEREAGEKNFIIIQNEPELVDGAYYDLILAGKDRAGNLSNKAVAKNIKYDITPPVISINNPTPNIFITSTKIEYDFSEDMEKAFVKFEYSGGDYDLGSPHIFNIEGENLKIGSHFIEPEFIPELMEGTQYTLSINGEDLAGNPADPAVVLSVVYDAYPPVLALNSPLPNSYINNSKISYSINESLLEASLVWEATGGAYDPNSPHRINLNEDEKKKGAYLDTVLISQTKLQDSTVYKVTFFGKDPAGNESNLIINDNVTFDISSPIITIIDPGNNHYTPGTNINYSTSEDLLSAKIIYVGTSGDKKRLNTEIVITPEGLLAGIHNSDDYNKADLRDSATYMIGFEARDLAGNYARPVGLYNYHVDRTLPIISILSPKSNSYSNYPLFEYFLSEDIYYGKVTFFEQTDSLSLLPGIEFELDSTEFSIGIHGLDTLVNQLPLKDSTLYSIQVKVYDIAKNWNDTTIISDFYYDITSPYVSIIDPIDSSFINTNAVSISNSEELLSADMYWVNIEGDAVSTRIREGDLVSGENRLVMYPTSLNENTHYDLFIIGKDLAGNSFQTDITNGIIYDITTPIITLNKPTEGGYINTRALSYDLSEPLIQANVIWEIKTGVDTLSPHRAELKSEELTSGNHDSTFFSYIPDLIDGEWYGITMAGVDRAGNQSEVVTISRAKYDFTYPIFYDLKPDANQWIRKLDLAYTLSEDLIFGRIVFRHVGGEPDPDGEYLVRLEGSRLKAGPGGGELPRSLVRLVSGGIYSITYTGRDSANNFVSEFIIPNVRFDNIKPFIVLTEPSATQTVFDSYKWPYTNSEKVSFTLSEDLKEASLTIVNTGGKTDPRSPIEIQLTKNEMIEGSFIDSILFNSVNLIDSAIYTYSLNGIDSAGNIADGFTTSNIHYDITKPNIDLILPPENGALNAPLLSYDFSEIMLNASLIITQTGGQPDSLSPHNVEVVMYELAEGNADSVIITNSPQLTDGSIYNYEFRGQDLAKNSSNIIVSNNVLFDTTVPVVSMSRPIDSEILNTVDVSFLNSENIHVGDFIFTRTSGTSDPGSPHRISVLNDGLLEGMHTDWELDLKGNLTDGTRYKITFDGNDRAGNKVKFTPISNVLYDINPPIVIVEYPLDNGYFNAPKFTYSTNEQLKDAIITISHISGPDDINSPHTLDIPSTYRFEGFYQEVNFEDKIQLVDGASYEISIIATDMAKNTAETIIISNVTFDITPPILSVIAPIENSYYLDFLFNYNISEPLSFGRVNVQRVRGVYDADSPHIIELVNEQLSILENNMIDLDQQLPLKSGAGYDIEISILDRAGNSSDEQILIENVTYDTIPPVIAVLAPSLDDYINYKGISYSTNESLRELELIWTRVGGTPDSDSPHSAYLPKEYLPQGRYENIRLEDSLALLNNTEYSLSIIATDLGGNKRSKVINKVIYDDLVPEFTITQPQSGSFINTSALSYNLSEKLIEGAIIWEPVDLSGGSPIKVILKESEMNSGSFNEIIFENQPGLIDGLLYNLSIDAYDRAENRLSILLSDSVTYDITPPDFTDIAPEAGSYVNSGIVKFTNTEQLFSAAVIWERIDGEVDNNSPHTIDIPSEYFAVGPQETSNITTPDLINGTVYRLTLNGRDLAGNVSGVVYHNMNYDTENPELRIIYPLEQPAINNTDIGYVLSEQLGFATLKYTWLEGAEDGNSPHIINLDARSLPEGETNKYPLSPAPFLVDGSKYKIEFEGVDRAGNKSNISIRESILYDITKPILSMSVPTDGLVSIGKEISYSVSEDLDKSMVVWNSVGGNNDVNSPHNIELLDAEKMKGDYDLVILNNTYELLSSTTYNVSISGTDPAGNESEPFVIKNVDYVRKIDGQWIFKGAVITVVWNFTTTSGDDGLTGDFEQWIQMGAKVSNREKGTFSIDYSVKPWSLDWTMTSSGIRRISLFNFGDNETLNVITGESKPEDWEDGQIMQYKYNQ